MLLRDHLKDAAQCDLKAGAGVGGSLQLANALEAIAQGGLVGRWELGRVIGALITAERQRGLGTMTIAITADDTIVNDLRASLQSLLRGGSVQAGMTWGTFKAAVKALGVADADRIASIEFGCKQYGSGRIVRDDAPDGIEIREA